ncbi:helix-turn-helix domain-containing protein [Brevibacillus ginsengisoli]|uniref:helix-turn-helix transcriptional regulator n=1 Tax=Brevibacillus ginsengisoli TaxID=363854 RepID=UPI003CF40BF8
MGLKLELAHTKIFVCHISPESTESLHSHADEYQIHLPLRGKILLTRDKEQKALSQRDRLVVSPHDLHRLGSIDEQAQILILSVHQQLLNGIVEEQLQLNPEAFRLQPWGKGSPSRFITWGKRAMNLFWDPLHSEDLHGLEMELVQLLLSGQEGSHTSAWLKNRLPSRPTILDRIIRFIDTNISELITPGTLCEEFQIDSFRLIRLFSEHLHCTPGLYIKEAKLRHAVQLLKNTSKSITDIALLSGFGSISSFQRAFKQKFGVSAGQYREFL